VDKPAGVAVARAGSDHRRARERDRRRHGEMWPLRGAADARGESRVQERARASVVSHGASGSWCAAGRPRGAASARSFFELAWVRADRISGFTWADDQQDGCRRESYRRGPLKWSALVTPGRLWPVGLPGSPVEFSRMSRDYFEPSVIHSF